MTLFGRVTVGGVVLREAWEVPQSGAGLSLTGEESTPPDARAAVEAAHRNINGLPGSVVPVVFSEKAHLSGFYRVGDASSELFDRLGVVRARWSLSLELVGTQRDVEFESRVPTISRASEITGTPSFWHAPPVGFTSYYTGATVPTGTTPRTSADGVVTVYRGIPNAVLPRWTVAVGDYLKGSARLLFDGFQIAGDSTPSGAAPAVGGFGVDPFGMSAFGGSAGSTWELSNGLVRVTQDGAGVALSAWAGDGWKSTKGYRFAVGGAALDGTPEATVLRCDPEECVLRLSWAVAPGRVVLDLALRRGSVFVTGVMKRHAATSLAVLRSPNEAATTATGGLRATNTDADGNRYVIGSSRTVVADTTIGALTRGGSTTFDFFLGFEVGATPAAGNAFADLFSQYLGTASERVRAVRR